MELLNWHLHLDDFFFDVIQIARYQHRRILVFSAWRYDGSKVRTFTVDRIGWRFNRYFSGRIGRRDHFCPGSVIGSTAVLSMGVTNFEEEVQRILAKSSLRFYSFWVSDF